MDTSSSNLTVRERADVFERLERSLSAERSSSRPSSEHIPGYLRSTTSAAKKFNLKRDSLGGDVDCIRLKRQRLADSFIPTDRPDRGSSLNRPSLSLPRSRESSVLSISSASNNHINITAPTDEESLELVGLYAKYLQYQSLLLNMDQRYHKLQSTAESQLTIGYKALEVKQALDKREQEEKVEEEDDENELLDHFAQLPKVLDQMEAKVHNHENIDEEKRILNEMLVYMNDIKIPTSKVHDNIEQLAETRELIQDIVDSGHKFTNSEKLF